MTSTADVLTPCILVVDDERQIHSSLRLRLGEQYRLTCIASASEALACVRQQPFDLCIVDVHMPRMDGFDFISAAKELDPGLGFVVLSGYDTEENLRRAIPLQVFDFIAKPLPDRESLEHRLPDWIARTRRRRQETALSHENQGFVRDLELARIERDVESTASDTARQALWQAVSSLTTIQALLLNAWHTADVIDRRDPKLQPLLRSLQEAKRQTADAATLAESYFASAYADRESSPAVIDTGLRHGTDIGLRRARAAERNQAVDLNLLGRDLALGGLTGMDFLTMYIPAVMLVLQQSPANTTAKVSCSSVARLGDIPQDPRWRSALWVNRRNSLSSHPGVVVSLLSSSPAWHETAAASWLRGDPSSSPDIPSRSLILGVQKAKGLLGLTVQPDSDRLGLVIALPAA